MGRGRGKGRKLNGNVNHEDCGSGEEEKIPVQKKRGRPLKHLRKADIREVNKVEKEDGEDVSNVISSKKAKYQSKEMEKSDAVKEESGNETKSSSIEEEPVKPIGFHQNSRRRKNKPSRAAEAVVECN